MKKYVYIILAILSVAVFVYMCYESYIYAVRLFTPEDSVKLVRCINWWLATVGWASILVQTVKRCRKEWRNK